MDLAPETSSPATADESDPSRPGRINPDLFARNMAAFARLLPGLHTRLAQITGTESTLVANPGGGYDIEMGGTRLYDGDPRALARSKVKSFFRTPEERIRVQISPPDTGKLDAHANKPVYNLLKRATGDYGIVFSQKRTTTDCFHLVVLGIGLAEHIPHLVKRTRCRHLVLAEPNIEFIYHSLHTFDWGRFFAGYLKGEQSINFVTDVTPAAISSSVRNLIRYVNAPAFDGTYIYVAHPGSFLDAVTLDISKNRASVITGLGFLEDERDMIRNAYGNLVDYRDKFIGRHDFKPPIPVFVVASGPSIDNDLDFIRANADRAVIVSCGTTLRILLKNGIRPDFHMEMENIPAVYDLISQWSESYSLKGITLVASITIDPRVRTLFERSIFYVRPGIVTWPMFQFGDDTYLLHASPMVANLGLSFAQHTGAGVVYFFGVDCGTRDLKHHHGKDAAYNAGEIEFTTVIDTPVPGNFGGTVYSEFVYLWSRDELHHAILASVPRIAHYNCADGVRIEGATPKLSRTVTLPAVDKAAVVAKLLDSYKDYPADQFEKSWTKRNLVRATLEFCNRLHDGLNDPPKDPKSPATRAGRKSPLDFLARTVKNAVPATPEANTPEHHFFRGTIFMALIACYFYEGRITNPRKRAVFRRLMKEELAGLFRVIADYALDFYRELDPDKIKRDEEEAADLLKKPKPKAKKAKKPRAKSRKSATARATTRAKTPRKKPKKPTAKKKPARAARSRRKGNRRPSPSR